MSSNHSSRVSNPLGPQIVTHPPDTADSEQDSLPDHLNGAVSQYQRGASTDQISAGLTTPLAPEERGVAGGPSEENTPTTQGPWIKKYLLTFDGGGVRGYSSLLILREVMDIIGRIEKQYDQDATSSHHPRPYVFPTGAKIPPGSADSSSSSFRYLPCHYFDYIAGTSTGGLISIMLGRLRMTVDCCIQEYETFGDDVFGKGRLFSVRGPLPALRDKYNPERLSRVVGKVVSRRLPGGPVLQDAFASPPRMCRTIVLAFRKNAETEGSPYLFRTYDHFAARDPNPLELNTGPAHTIPIWQVARATSAAPTYFDHVKINEDFFLDGGFGANNPTMHAFVEVSQMSHEDDTALGLTVSIGTGQSRPMSRFATGLFPKYWAYWNFAKKWASNAEQNHIWMGMHTGRGIKYPYRRFNVEDGLGNMKLDEWNNKDWMRRKRKSNKTIAHIKEVAARYLQQPEVQKDLRYVAQILVDNRRARSKTSLWRLMSSGTRWRCDLSQCAFYEFPFETDDELRRHLTTDHADLGYVRYDTMTESERQRLDDTVRRGELPL